MKKTLASLASALVLAGCATVPEIDTSAIPAAPAQFREAGRWTQATPAEASPRGEWWKAFADPILDGLIARAERGNTTIQVAAARLAQARALVQSTRADQLPRLDAAASAARAGANAGSPGNAFTAAVGVSYEVDLFGRLAQATRAASLDAESREALMQSTRLAIQAEVAQAYFALRALDVERELVRGTLAAYRDTLGLTQRRFRAGDVAELDVARAEAEVAATETEALALDQRRAHLEHALAVLVGETATAFSLGEAEWTTRLPVIPAGVPATVLARRPDVSAAQSALLAAQARVGVAKAAWFPDISLTAAGGYASPEIGDLLKWSARSWTAGALLALPIFDGGRREAGVKSASAEMDAALARYREQLLVALREVEDQLASLRLLSGQAEAQGRAVAAAARSTYLSNSRYRNGLVSQLDLLDAWRSELRNRRQALRVKSEQYQATVGLIRALGGSWERAS